MYNQIIELRTYTKKQRNEILKLIREKIKEQNKSQIWARNSVDYSLRKVIR